MSLRRLRLEQALKCQIRRMPIHTPKETSFEDCKQKYKFSLEKMYEMREMKFQVLENWEQTKRNAIEKLAVEIEDLQVIEEQIELKENELEQKGVKANEEGFKQFCSGALVNLESTSTPKNQRPAKKIKSEDMHFKKIPNLDLSFDSHDDSDDIVIGPNGTKISKVALYNINWMGSGAAVTRKLLMEVFDRDTLAFHTLTGKPSPAFIDCDKPMKHQLDPLKVADIIYIVTKNLPITAKEVRSAITTKCADENKMFRQREKKRQSLKNNSNKENIPNY